MESKIEFLRIKGFTVEVAKEFRIEEFLDSYPAKVSSNRVSKLKKLFIQSVQMLEEEKLIEVQYQNLNDGQFYSIQNLQPRTLGK